MTTEHEQINKLAKQAGFNEKQFAALFWDVGPYEVTEPRPALEAFYHAARKDLEQQLASANAEIERMRERDSDYAGKCSMLAARDNEVVAMRQQLAAAQEALGEYLCSVDDLPSAIRRLVSAYKERNETAAKFHTQLNAQEEEFATKLAENEADNKRLSSAVMLRADRLASAQAQIRQYRDALYTCRTSETSMHQSHDQHRVAAALALPADTSALEAIKAEAIKKATSGHVEEISLLKAEVERLRNVKMARFNNEDCWIYQGDGNDNLESLACPVVIYPEALEAIVKQAGEVMRERCAKHCDEAESQYFDGYEFRNVLPSDLCEDIRALPGVKLEDLK